MPPFTRNVAAAVLHPEPVGRLPRVGVPRDRAVAGAPHAHRRHVLRLQHHPHQVGRIYETHLDTGLKVFLGQRFCVLCFEICTPSLFPPRTSTQNL